MEVAISITSLNNDLTRKLEPRAAAPRRRLKTITNLSNAGIPTTVLNAPIIPAINDHEIEKILSESKSAGASSAGYVIIRLPNELPEVFSEWLKTHMPDREKKVMSQIRELHGGKIYNPESFTRHRGTGVMANLIQKRFDVARRRLQLDVPRQTKVRTDLFTPPGKSKPLF